MSQDTHLFSVRRPRETLGSLNYNSAIPQPASALKRSNSISNLKESQIQPPHTIHHGRSASSSRMSFAPNRPPQPAFQRSSSGTNLADMGRPSTVQRSSSTNLFAANTSSRISYAPGGAMTPHMQHPLSASQSLQRRSSIYSRPSTSGPMGHQSFFVQAPVPAGVPKDPRPLKDRSSQNTMAEELLAYMTENNFEMEMKHSIVNIRSPIQKDFDYMFQWLYHRIDPAYRFQKNIATEVPPILKQLRYPYEKSITKSQIAAVGSASTWPTFLGMLHWIMQLAQMLERYERGDFDDACAQAGVDVSGDRIIFRFLGGAYSAFLSSTPTDDPEADEEDFKQQLRPHVEAMAAEFDRGNKAYAEDLEMFEAANAALMKQIEEAERDTPDNAKLDKAHLILVDDIKKFEEWVPHGEKKTHKFETQNEHLRKDIENWEEELQNASHEKRALQKAVDEQGISIEDIDRMNGERERLQKGLEAAKLRLEETRRKVAEKEAEAGSKLANLEVAVDEYNSLCYRVGLLPSTAANAKGEEYELRLSLTNAPAFSSSQLGASQYGDGDRLLADASAGYHPAKVLNLDLRGAIKNQLNILRININKRRNAARDHDEENRRLLDELSEAIDDKKNEVAALEHRVRAGEEEFEKTKEVTSTQKLASDAQIEKMEKELAKMRSGLTESVQLMEQREMNTNIEYEQLTLRANALREELHTEIERMLNDIIKFKVHIQKSLEDYEGFVVEEVEQELGGEGESLEDTVRIDR
ncbi:kinetochore-associated Ndc80 complex subunit ndc80 [Xylographa soralifera]|nr:kinetochore-associated Ndc80 complex subunit ndc80 [Xylographa soralifera]